MVGADKIIGVDINDAKEEWGRRFGMTDFVNPKKIEGDIVAHLVELTDGGADYTFDCTGNTTVMRQALEACHRGWGVSTVIGVAEAGKEIATRPFQLVTGRVWKGTAFGGARGRTDVPKIVDWYMKGKIEIDPMITHVLSLEEINKGFDLMHAGRIDPLGGGLLMERTQRWRAHGGWQEVWRHQSQATGTGMEFSIFLPDAARARLPVVWFLSGLTCNWANVTEKGEFRAACARHGLIFVAPTPRRAARACPTIRRGPMISGSAPGSMSMRREPLGAALPDAQLSGAGTADAGRRAFPGRHGTGRGSWGIRWAGTGR
jgi:hypothetical protein